MFLTPNDFTIQNGELMRPNDQGYSFVFFFTYDCKDCDHVKPAFNYLSNHFKGINFCYMDMAQKNYMLMYMSRHSKTPIEYVPFLLLFANGRPIAQFFQDEENPQNNIPKMENFILANTRRHQQQTQGSKSGSSKPEGEGIPPYSIGIPGNLALKKVCKLYDNAYNK